MIPTTKFGVCCICDTGEETKVIKRGKELFCIRHAQAQSAKKYLATAKERDRMRSQVSSPDNTEDDKVYKAQMDLFWLHAAKEIEKNPYCAECLLKGGRTFIPKEFYRHASAHCIPKRKEFGFPSVAANIINLLILSPHCGHHSLYDRSWEDASTMAIFPLAIEKVKLLYPFIAKAELKNLPEVFRQELNL